MKSVLFKQFLLTILLILFSVMVVGVSLISASSSYIGVQQQRMLTRNAENTALLVEANVTHALSELPFQFRMTLTTMSRVAGGHILLCGVDGLVRMSSDAPGHERVGWAIPEAIAEQVLVHGSFEGRTSLGGLFSSARMVSGRLVRGTDGAPVGMVFVSGEVADQQVLLAGFIRIFVLAGLIVLLVAYASAYIVSSRLSRPLRRMTLAAQNFASGDFSVRVPTDAHDDDISELARSFNAMADALQRLEELRRGFVANVSHELRTPMTTISGFIDGVLDGAIPPERHSEYLSIVRDEIRRLSRLVARMLDVARLQSGETDFHPSSVDVTEAISRVIVSLEARIDEKSLAVEVDMPQEPVMVMFDPDALIQVVYNLSDNAVKFAQTSLAFAVTKKGGKIQVSVSNDGQTIPPDDLPYVFDRFHKTDKARTGGGLGLGLYIVRSILHSHKEEVSAVSGTGRTCFAFTLTPAK